MLLRQAVDLFLDGHRHAERRFAQAAEAAGPAADPTVAAIRVMLAIRAGRLSEAEALAGERRDRARSAGDPEADAVHGEQIAAIRWFQGRITEIWPSFGRDADRCAPPRSTARVGVLFLMVEAAAHRDDATACARAYDELLPHAGRPAIAGPALLCLGAVQHALGVAALTSGRADLAVAHLRAAVEENLALRHWPALVLSRFRYAQALTRRGLGPDARLAAEVLATARREAGELGMPHPAYAGEAPPRSAVATCDRTGGQWRLRYGRRTVLAPDSVGMSHLAVLLAHPGRPVAAADLVAGVRAVRVRGAGGADPLDRERARLAAGKAIRRAIAAITRLDPRVGAHLEECVRPGTRCAYLPR